MALNYILVPIPFIVVIGFIIYMFYRTGYFRLYVEVDVKKGRIYAWYKSEVIESDCFYLTDPVDEINIKIDNVKRDAISKIKRIKELKSKL